MQDQMKTIGFAAAVCIICSFLLAFSYSYLRDEQERNKENDLKMKVLTAVGEKIRDEKGRLVVSGDKVAGLFESKIKGIVLDSRGEVTEMKVEQLTPEQINERGPDGLKHYYPLFVYTDEASGVKRYAIHVSGMGLWSVVKGYIALNDDMATIAGVAFYEHMETPGLGGEIEKPFFQDRFTGKTLYKDGQARKFVIQKPGKGAVDDHTIDGISGATMTCKGVMNLINSDFAVYNKYFEKIRKK